MERVRAGLAFPQAGPHDLSRRRTLAGFALAVVAPGLLTVLLVLIPHHGGLALTVPLYLLATVIVALLDPEPVTKLAAAGLSMAEAVALLLLLGYSRERWQMRLGVSEALHNALTHGCRDDKSRMVHLEMKADRESACVAVEDDGGGFDVEAAVNAFNPEENIYSGSGRGIYLIRHCMDEVIWNKKGNRIAMIKKTTNPEEEGGNGLQR